MTHAVVAKPQFPLLPLPAEVEEILVGLGGLHPQEARSRRRYYGGILLPGVSAVTADAVVEALEAAGVPTRSVARERLDALPRRRRVLRVRVDPEGLRWWRVTGQESLVPWARLRGIDLYVVESCEPTASARADTPNADELVARAETERLLDGDAVDEPSAMGSRLLEALRDADARTAPFCATLFLDDPLELLGLERDGLEYSVLGDAKSPHLIDNWLTTLQSILDAPASLLNRANCDRMLADLSSDDSSGDRDLIRPILRSREGHWTEFERVFCLWLSELPADLDAGPSTASNGVRPTDDGEEP